MNSDNNAIPVGHITGDPDENGLVTSACGMTFKPVGYVNDVHDRHVICPLCELAATLKDISPLAVRDAEAMYASSEFTRSVRRMCDAQQITLRQVALRASIPLSTFYSRTSGRSVWSVDEINRIVDALESTLPAQRSRS